MRPQSLVSLNSNSTLTTLDLSNNIIVEGDEIVSHILQSKNLTKLLFNDSLIGDVTTLISLGLKSNNSLRTLELSKNSIGSDGVASLFQALQSNSTLTSLSLSFNNIEDYGMTSISQALQASNTLTYLDIHSNCLGDTGISLISDGLKLNSSLISLNISGNMFGDAGAQAIATALSCNSTLTFLNISYNKIGGPGMEAISESLSLNYTLTNIIYDESFFKRSFHDLMKDSTKVCEWPKSHSGLSLQSQKRIQELVVIVKLYLVPKDLTMKIIKFWMKLNNKTK
uniref:Uncharacterized protein n=1 Tax=Arcella intermedia TaxID=1963864 RepID=A0A6B2L9A5_9EUKA